MLEQTRMRETMQRTQLKILAGVEPQQRLNVDTDSADGILAGFDGRKLTWDNRWPATEDDLLLRGQVKLADYNIMVAWAQYLPDMSLSLNNNPPSGQYQPASGSEDTFLHFNISFPLVDWGRRYRGVQTARMQKAQAFHEMARKRTDYSNNWLQAEQRVSLAETELKLAKTRLDTAAMQYKEAHISFNEGIEQFPEVAKRHEAEVQARVAYIKADLECRLAVWNGCMWPTCCRSVFWGCPPRRYCNAACPYSLPCGLAPRRLVVCARPGRVFVGRFAVCTAADSAPGCTVRQRGRGAAFHRQWRHYPHGQGGDHRHPRRALCPSTPWWIRCWSSPAMPVHKGAPLLRYHLQEEAERVLQREVTTGAGTEDLKGQALDLERRLAETSAQRNKTRQLVASGLGSRQALSRLEDDVHSLQRRIELLRTTISKTESNFAARLKELGGYFGAPIREGEILPATLTLTAPIEGYVLSLDTTLNAGTLLPAGSAPSAWGSWTPCSSRCPSTRPKSAPSRRETLWRWKFPPSTTKSFWAK